MVHAAPTNCACSSSLPRLARHGCFDEWPIAINAAAAPTSNGMPPMVAPGLNTGRSPGSSRAAPVTLASAVWAASAPAAPAPRMASDPVSGSRTMPCNVPDTSGSGETPLHPRLISIDCACAGPALQTPAMTNSTAPQVCRFTCASPQADLKVGLYVRLLLRPTSRSPATYSYYPQLPAISRFRHPFEADQPPRPIAQPEVRVHRNGPRGVRPIDGTHRDLDEAAFCRRQAARHLERRRAARRVRNRAYSAGGVIEG